MCSHSSHLVGVLHETIKNCEVLEMHCGSAHWYKTKLFMLHLIGVIQSVIYIFGAFDFGNYPFEFEF